MAEEVAAAYVLVFTHPADFGWSDLGNWASLHDKLAKDDDGNGIVGNVRLYECHDLWNNTRDSLRHLMIFPKDAFRVWVLRLQEGVVQVMEKRR